jgi:hypothetical protein
MIEIKRKYVQGGKVIDNSFTKLESLTKQYNSVSDEFCVAQKKAFGDNDRFTDDSSFRQVRATLNKGHVVMLWLWDDHDVNMLWMARCARRTPTKRARNVDPIRPRREVLPISNPRLPARRLSTPTSASATSTRPTSK